jgi:small subunit ribosomal protein S6
MRENSTRYYEMMLITHPEGTPEELSATVDRVLGYITSAGGSIIRSSFDSPWGRRRLAYPIRHESQDVRDGFYTLIHLELAPDQVVEVERELKLNDRLLRYLLLQLPEMPVFPEPEPEETDGEPADGAPAQTAEQPQAQTAPSESAELEPAAPAEAESTTEPPAGESASEEKESTAPLDASAESSTAETPEAEADASEEE